MQLTKGFKRYFENTSWLLLERVISLISGFFVGIYVIRYLGPANYGLLSYSRSIIGLLGPFVGLGLSGIIVRNLVNNPDKKNVLLGTSFLLKFLISSTIFFLLLSYYLIFTEKNTSGKMICIISVGLIIDSLVVMEFYFDSKVLSKYKVLSRVIALTITSIIKIIFVIFHFELIYFVYVIIFEKTVLTLFLILFYSKKKQSILDWKFDTNLAKRIILDSWPLLLYGITMGVILRTDQVMIQKLMNSTSVGIYAAAVKISNLWYIIPSIFAASLFPALINAKKVKEGLFIERLEKLYAFLIWLSIFAAFFITFFSKWIISFIYGDAYINSYNVLIIHFWTGVFMSINIVNNKWFVINNNQKIFFYRSVLGAIINIILNFIFILKWGVIGAALSSLISFVFIAYFGLLINKKTISLFIIISKSFLPINLIKWLKYEK